MKNLNKKRTYKIYLNGQAFLLENAGYLKATINTEIETAFFENNANLYTTLNRKNYAFLFKEDNDILLLLKCEPYNALIFGSSKLCSYAANIIADYNLEVKRLLGENEVVQEFFKAYQDRLRGSIEVEHSMQIMVLHQLKSISTEEVFLCSSLDLNRLAECYISFYKEALATEIDFKTVKKQLQGNEHNVYALAVDDKIVCIASKTRDDDTICAISHVFTIPQYRGLGYARKVVTKISQDILDEGKIPYLFVDTENPISNHLYLSMGFQYLLHQSQVCYQPTTIKKALLAGGCFWCLAAPYYSHSGVLKVLSGFTGGNEINPSYEDVKYGKTHHREAILIEYDSSKMNYNTILDIYFSSIDPFDGEGQFIDRGENYTCRIYTSDPLEREEALKRITALEKEAQKKVCVDLCEDMIFYPAEEEHQDYALKNPQAMQEELKASGRLKKGGK